MQKVSNKESIPAGHWLEASLYLTVLIGEEHDKLLELQQEIAKMKYEQITKGSKVNQANAFIETTDIYKTYCKQKAFIEQVEELVRISKLQARMKDNEWGMQQ